MYKMIQVLPHYRKHPLLIDFKFSKMIVYRCKILCKNLFIFFNETGKKNKYFILIQ
jgi:hypothetical protein